jgi:hypothetical protein
MVWSESLEVVSKLPSILRSQMNYCLQEIWLPSHMIGTVFRHGWLCQRASVHSYAGVGANVSVHKIDYFMKQTFSIVDKID